MKTPNIITLILCSLTVLYVVSYFIINKIGFDCFWKGYMCNQLHPLILNLLVAGLTFGLFFGLILIINLFIILYENTQNRSDKQNSKKED